MRATFKPTGYVFNLDDRFFVESQATDGACKTVAAFSDLGDANDFAKALLQRHGVKASYVFTREHQVSSFHKHGQRAA